MEDGSTESNGIINFNDLELLDEVKKGYLVLQRRSLVLRETILWGYHKLQLDGQPDELTLIVTPSNCWLPAALLGGHRAWGVSTQLYLQRSKNIGVSAISPIFEI